MHSQTYEYGVQGEVTLNVTLDSREVVTRQNALKYNADKAYPGADGAFRVNEGDLVFARKEASWNPHTGTAFRGKPAVFATINGVIYATAKSQADLGAGWWFVGVAKFTVDAKKPNSATNSSGLSVVVAGGPVSVPYFHRAYAFPGDLVMYQWPDPHSTPDPTFGTDTRTGRLPPVVKPVDLRDLLHVRHVQYMELMQTRGAEEPLFTTNLQRLHEGRHKAGTFTSRERAALGMQRNTLTTGVRFVESNVNRGILKIMTPEETERERLLDAFLANPDASAAEFRAAMDAVPATDVTAEANRNVRFRTGNDGLGGVEEPIHTHGHAYFKRGMHIRKERATALAKRKRDVLWLAAAYGVAGDEPEQVWVEDALRTVHYALDQMRPDGDMASYTYAPLNEQTSSSAASEALQAMQNMAVYGGRGGTGVARRLASLESDYLENARNHDTEAVQAVAQAQFEFGERIIGRALNMGTPGRDRRLNVVLQGSLGLR